MMASRSQISEDDIVKYLAKKAVKKVTKTAKTLKPSDSFFGYSKTSNRFGDSTLNEKYFVWRKKIERDVSRGVSLDMFSPKALKKKRQETLAEIEKIIKRREERAFERAQHEETMALVARKRAQAEFHEEVKDFDNVRLHEEEVIKPVDTLSMNLDRFDWFMLRKPEYINRVHTGYQWNRYNRTHYDHDHPPPKFVQGYKFDIFYPDLIDKTKVPSYTLEKDGDNNVETCIIRFHGGPPYEDIAFCIVNDEWEYSHKNGFKCTFDQQGTLHLYFNFKRFVYRR